MGDPQLGRVVAVLLRDARRDHDHRQTTQPLVGPHVAHQVEAVHARHLDVRQHDPRQFLGQPFERVQAVLGQGDAVAFTHQQSLCDAAHGQRIVHHQHQRCQRRHRCRRRQQAMQPGIGPAATGGASVVTVQRGQRHRVVDQRHRARGQQRDARQSGQADHLRAQVLDDHFVVAQHFVDLHRHALLRTAYHHHGARATARFGAARTLLQQRAEPVEGHRPVRHRERSAGVGRVDFLGQGAAHDLHQRRRHRHDGASTTQHHDLRDRGGQRQDQLERGALPGRRGGLDAAAHRVDFRQDHVHADATTCQFGDAAGGRKTGLEDQVGQFTIGRLRIGRQQAERQALLADARQVQPGTVVTHFDTDLVALVAQRHGDRAVRFLACVAAGLRRFDAVRDAVAQQVLERRRHALQHAAVDLDRAAEDVQPHLFAGFLGSQTHHAVQPVGLALELDHSGSQQTVLQVARQARLGDQFVLGALQRALKGALHGRHVVDRLGHRARDFLETREAIRLERIERLCRGLGGLNARTHLRLSLQLDVVQMAAQAFQVFRQVDQRSLDLLHLRLDARARDAHLARMVDQPIEQRRAHPHRGLRRGLHPLGRAARRAVATDEA